MARPRATLEIVGQPILAASRLLGGFFLPARGRLYFVVTTLARAEQGRGPGFALVRAHGRL